MLQRKKSRWAQHYGYGTIYGKTRAPIRLPLIQSNFPYEAGLLWLAFYFHSGIPKQLHDYILSNADSGGIDSCATAIIVSSMSRLLIEAIRNGNAQVISDVQRIAGAYEKEDWLPQSAQALTKNLFQYVGP